MDRKKGISTAVTTAYKSHRKTCDRVGVTRDMGVHARCMQPSRLQSSRSDAKRFYCKKVASSEEYQKSRTPTRQASYVIS